MLGCNAVTSVGVGGQAATPVVVIATPSPLPPEAFQAVDVEEQVVINVYERVSPSVVHITSRTQVFDFLPRPRAARGQRLRLCAGH
jgi:hypothetical protein